MSNSGDSERCRLRASRTLLIVSTVLCSGLIAPAFGQVAAPAPVRSNIDSHGVDLFLGTMNVDGPTLSAGDGNNQGLTWQKLARGRNGFGDTLIGTLVVSGTTTYISFGGVTHAFTSSGTTYISTEGDGSTLVKSGSTYTYTAADGTVGVFTSSYAGAYPYGNIQGNVTSVTKPNGAKFTYSYDSARYCAASKEGSGGQICTQRKYTYRIASVTSNAQYALTFQYANDSSSFDPDDAGGNNFSGWGDITSVSLKNNATGGVARTQAFSSSNTQFTITDAIGRATTYRFVPYPAVAAFAIAGITRPGSSGEDVAATYDAAGKLFTLTDASGTTTYTYGDSGNNRTTTVTDPLGHSKSYVFNIALQRPISVTTATGNTATSAYDGYGRVTRVTAPDGNYTTVAYDGWGNVTQTQAVAKPGSGTPTLTTIASYPCTTAATCNKPAWTRDANGFQTDYSYDSSTGNVTSVTAPPSTSGVRATTTFSYTTVNGVQMVSGSSTCSTTASCVGTANETKSSIGYNANGLPTTATTQAGNGSISATTTRTYDSVGNIASIDGPLPGSDDTVGYRYDADREVVGIIGLDPDGAGPHRRTAQRYTYDAKGRVTQIDIGTVPDVSDAGWNTFASQQQTTTTYDGVDRPLTQTFVAGGTSYSATTHAYNHQRLDTITVAMNGQGADRVTKYSYDDADRQTKVTSAYGTAEQADDVTTDYTPNGMVRTRADANGNVTIYGYDGLDRIATATYPGGSYDQASYDSDGHVTQRRMRDGSVINYGYDALGRVVSKDRPNTAYWETDQSFAYDLLGRLTTANDSNGRSLGFGYDALGRQTSNSDNWYSYGNASSQYDAAGRRTRYAWADGFYVTYEYDAAGNMTAIRENGGAALVTIGYDDLGRRTSLSRANGTSTSYGYDPASRLTGLTLAGGNQPNAVTLSYNPAGQITSRTASNDAFTWTAAVNADRSYGVNALNQYTSAGGITFSYDGRGNLAASGDSSYTYTADNQLATSPATGLAYDPLGRLFNGAIDPGVNTTLVYDGASVTAEIDQNNPGGLLRRYVYGPGSDEPLVWYEGTGTGDRRYLAADERGSIVAITNDAGNAIAVNRYDEYGIPQAGNIGRFQYTGQKWLPTLGLYDYKARTYSPTLGRFMQTDPIGYRDGMNWYNYAGGDPVNSTDPDGLLAAYPIGGWVLTASRGQVFSWEYITPGLSRNSEPADREGGSEIKVTGKRQQNNQPDCNTALPNGKTVGDTVRGAIDDTLTAGADVGSNTDYAASVQGKMAFYTFPKGPLDFKNIYRGQGDPASLAAAGNFAYGAYVSALAGPSVSNFGAKLYGTVAGWLGLKSSKFLAPNGMSKSGAANVPRGNANAGCPR